MGEFAEAVDRCFRGGCECGYSADVDAVRAFKIATIEPLVELQLINGPLMRFMLF